MSAAAFATMPIGGFLDRLASDCPTPGGGSVAALTGALAASLGHMTCALTIGKPKFADVEGRVRQIAGRLERVDRMFRRLMDEDAAAYRELSTAFKLEKADPLRRARIQQAAGLAASVPFATVAAAHQMLQDLETLASIGNPNLKSDIEAATHLTHAAMHAAAANVRANLPFMDAEEARQIGGDLATLLGT
jgi:formiminotetrahydrofolate cyclodeaminase